VKTKLNRRVLCTIGAAIVALSMIIGGVFAWVDSSQHKSNVVTGGGKTEKNDVVLVEDFEEPDDWFEGDLKKEVWIKNTGDGQVYVRLQLKEYMDIAKVTYEYSEDFLLVDSDGKFVASTGSTPAELTSFKTWLSNNGIPHTDAQIILLTAYGETAARYYLITDETTNVNGRYGKRLLLDYSQAAPKSLVDGVVRGTYENTVDHRNHPTSECLYTPHLWNDPPAGLNNCGQGDDSALYDGTGQGFHDYVEWTLGAPLIKLSDWNGQPVAAWILDDSSVEGWAYWGEALRPGDETTKILEKITLIQQPDGPFYYAIHVDMQAADLYQLAANFTDIPQKINDSYRGKIGFYINPKKAQSVFQGGTLEFGASWNGAAIVPLSDVTWTVSNIDAASLNSATRFNAATPGVLVVADTQALGKLLVTATYTSTEGLKTQYFVITVKPKAP